MTNLDHWTRSPAQARHVAAALFLYGMDDRTLTGWLIGFAEGMLSRRTEPAA